MEIFRQIKEYPRYSVSTHGRVRKNSTGRIMKPTLKPNGYMQINLFTNDGRRKKEYVHRLVAIAFIPNTEHYPEVNHIDGVRDNNFSSNLEWVTRKENVQKSGAVKAIVVKDVSGNTVGVFSCISDAVTDLGLLSSNISACLHGRQKTHRGYTFELKQ